MRGRTLYKRIFLAVSVLIPLICIYYVDSDSNIRQGMNVWEALFSGRFLEYFRINHDMYLRGQMRDTANYSVVLHLIASIWQLPLYIAEKIIGGNILEHFAARVWGKAMLIPALLWSSALVKRLAGILGYPEEKKEVCAFLYLTNALTTFSAFMAGQVDVLGLCFTLLAMCFLLEKKDLKFLITFAVAAQFKDFAYLIFLPVLLLREKNILRLAGTMAIPVLFGFLSELPFRLADPAGVATKGSRRWIMFDFLTRSRVDLVGGIEIPVVFLVLGAFCMLAYSMRVREEEELKRRSIYFALPGMLSILLCTKPNVYWSVYLVPFYTLLLVGRKEKRTIRLILETFSVGALTVAYMVMAAPMFGSMEGMLPDMICGGNLPDPMLSERFSEFVSQEKYFWFWTLSLAAFMVWISGFMILHRRGAQTQSGETGAGDIAAQEETACETQAKSHADSPAVLKEISCETQAKSRADSPAVLKEISCETQAKSHADNSSEREEPACEESPWVGGSDRQIRILLWVRAVLMYLICDIFIIATILLHFFR